MTKNRILKYGICKWYEANYTRVSRNRNINDDNWPQIENKNGNYTKKEKQNYYRHTHWSYYHNHRQRFKLLLLLVANIIRTFVLLVLFSSSKHFCLLKLVRTANDNHKIISIPIKYYLKCFFFKSLSIFTNSFLNIEFRHKINAFILITY